MSGKRIEQTSNCVGNLATLSSDRQLGPVGLSSHLCALAPCMLLLLSAFCLCCGKVFYDLLQKRREDGLENVAIIRIEQLYPFPKKALKQVLENYPNAKKIVWCQEEPQNQGVWFSSQHNMLDCLNEDQKLRYAGRAFAASPAVGSAALHAQQQAALVVDALYDSIK